jgi:hypothetical protein
LRKRTSIKLSKPQNDLLKLLSTFYKSLRYDRFSLSSVYEGQKEAAAIRALLAKHLKIEFDGNEHPFGTANEDRFRSFMSRTALKISRAIFEVIGERSRAIGLYTYELRNGSKAESVFLQEIKIGDEDTLWKELLVFFMNSPANNGYLQFLRQIVPLDFDPALVGAYLDCFESNASKAEVIDELQSLYDEMSSKERKERFQVMRVIGAPNLDFGDPEEEEDPPEEGS